MPGAKFRATCDLDMGSPTFWEHVLKVMLWEELRLLWWGPIRSNKSAEGGCVDIGAGLDVTGGTSLKRSGTTEELVETGGLTEEKAFQSPNSPFPVDTDPEQSIIYLKINCQTSLT